MGTAAQSLGLITFQLSYPVIIIRARLFTIGPEYEEAAMDLGATPTQAIRRSLLPMLFPAILASIAVTFADTVDDFVTVRYLSGPANSEPLSVKIYSAARASPTPAVNAAATVMLIATMLVIIVGYLVYRRISKGGGASRRLELRPGVAEGRPRPSSLNGGRRGARAGGSASLARRSATSLSPDAASGATPRRTFGSAMCVVVRPPGRERPNRRRIRVPSGGLHLD